MQQSILANILRRRCGEEALRLTLPSAPPERLNDLQPSTISSAWTAGLRRHAHTAAPRLSKLTPMSFCCTRHPNSFPQGGAKSSLSMTAVSVRRLFVTSSARRAIAGIVAVKLLFQGNSDRDLATQFKAKSCNDPRVIEYAIDKARICRQRLTHTRKVVAGSSVRSQQPLG